jgi:hypothetical protein
VQALGASTRLCFPVRASRRPGQPPRRPSPGQSRTHGRGSRWRPSLLTCGGGDSDSDSDSNGGSSSSSNSSTTTTTTTTTSASTSGSTSASASANIRGSPSARRPCPGVRPRANVHRGDRQRPPRPPRLDRDAESDSSFRASRGARRLPNLQTEARERAPTFPRALACAMRAYALHEVRKGHRSTRGRRRRRPVKFSRRRRRGCARRRRACAQYGRPRARAPTSAAARGVVTSERGSRARQLQARLPRVFSARTLGRWEAPRTAPRVRTHRTRDELPRGRRLLLPPPPPDQPATRPPSYARHHVPCVLTARGCHALRSHCPGARTPSSCEAPGHLTLAPAGLLLGLRRRSLWRAQPRHTPTHPGTPRHSVVCFLSKSTKGRRGVSGCLAPDNHTAMAISMFHPNPLRPSPFVKKLATASEKQRKGPLTLP